MDILTETLKRLKELYKAERLEPGTLSRAALMPKWNAVIGTRGQCGITMNFTDCQPAFGKPQVDTDRLRKFIGAGLFKVAAAYIKSSSLQERSIGVSALSALSQPLITTEMLKNRGFKVLGGNISFTSLLKADDIAAAVGYGGKLGEMADRCRELHVTDIRPREMFQTVMIDTDIYYTPRRIFVHEEKENRRVLGQATAVLITGSSLVNGTFEKLVSYARKARLICVWGPSAGIIPDVLFERGVHYVDTVQISSPEAFEQGVMNNEWDLKCVLPHTQQKLTVARR